MIYPLLKVERILVVRSLFAPYYGDGKREVNLRTTREGKHLYKNVGACIAAGGKVMLNITRDEVGNEWASGSLDWRPEDA